MEVVVVCIVFFSGLHHLFRYIALYISNWDVSFPQLTLLQVCIRNLELKCPESSCSCCMILTKSLQPPQNICWLLKPFICVSQIYRQCHWGGKICGNILNHCSPLKTFDYVSLCHSKHCGGVGYLL